mmetsp:Transcript_37830/g.57899  ORF Transcript_37830/g.57899 Transcript_37830/m.57899 type:complete len:80 (-) Transcript_37830:71-310(-)
MQFSVFRPLKYSSQVVAGTNYHILYQISDDKAAEVQVFQPLPSSSDAPEIKSVDIVDYKLSATSLTACALAVGAAIAYF